MKKIIRSSWCYDNNSVSLNTKETERYIKVIPSERQLNFLEMEYYNFIHFGINTMNNAEWGDGKEDISRFNPRRLDTDQWCRILKNTGSKGIIITAKHHDGFCLFDTKCTDHNVMNTPFKKDIVKMLSESCKKYGLKFGVYLSPWDRHEKTYGSEAYNDFFVSQLTELCENYGDIFCFWFDGACGEGPNGKKQIYDWERYYSVIRKYHPDAVISISGPDIRWIGNEGGRVRKSEWSVIPAALDSNEAVAENSQTDESQTNLMAEKIDERTEDLGSRDVLEKYDRLIFKPAEADVSVNTGWFWHNNFYYLFRKKRNAKQLADIYFNTVGGNASLLLNVPPDKDGLINKREIKILEEFTCLITSPLKNEITDKRLFTVTDEKEGRAFTDSMMLEDGEAGISVHFDTEKTVSALSFREDMRYSQRVEAFSVYAKDGDNYRDIYNGTVIGSRKIVRLPEAVTTSEILLVITQARANPVLRDIRVYG